MRTIIPLLALLFGLGLLPCPPPDRPDYSEGDDDDSGGPSYDDDDSATG